MEGTRSVINLLASSKEYDYTFIRTRTESTDGLSSSNSFAISFTFETLASIPGITSVVITKNTEKGLQKPEAWLKTEFYNHNALYKSFILHRKLSKIEYLSNVIQVTVITSLGLS